MIEDLTQDDRVGQMLLPQILAALATPPDCWTAGEAEVINVQPVKYAVTVRYTDNWGGNTVRTHYVEVTRTHE